MAGLFGGGLQRIRRQAGYLAPRIQREDERTTPAPIVQGTQARTRDEAQMGGLIGGSYKSPRAQGWWAEVMSDPFTALGGRAAFDRKYAAQAAEDEARRMAPILAAMTPEMQAVYNANPEKWGEFMAQNYAPQKVTAGDTLIMGGDTSKPFFAPKVGMDGGVPYAQTYGANGLNTRYGPRRPSTPEEIIKQQEARRPRIDNTGQAITATSFGEDGTPTTRVLHRDPQNAGGGPDKPPSGYYFTGNPEQPLAPIAGGPADPKRSGVDVDPKIIAMENTQSGRWMPIQNDFQKIKSEYGRIKAMGQRKDSVGDLALTVSLTKMLDPGSVARESEVEMTQSAAGALQQAAMWGPRLVDGKTKLPDNVRKMMVEAAGEMFGVYEGAYEGLARDMQSRLTQYGLSPERVMVGYEAKAPVKPKAVQTPAMQMGIRAYSKQTGIPVEAISEFLSNPATPQEIAEFNQAMEEAGFGPNQAEALLKALQGGR